VKTVKRSVISYDSDMTICPNRIPWPLWQATPTSTNFLHILEITTTSVLTSLLSAVNESQNRCGLVSFPCVLPNSGKSCVFSINIPMGKTINVGVLQRLKRQYTTMHKQANAAGRGTSSHDEDGIADSFVKYVQGAIWELAESCLSGTSV
jgi:hypothetical protein